MRALQTIARCTNRAGDDMKNKYRTKKKQRDRLGNRLALIGITGVILSMALVVNIKGASLKDKDLVYQLREENLKEQLKKEEARQAELEERRIYVQTKEYIQEVAKEKLGLVNPNEILLKPVEK